MKTIIILTVVFLLTFFMRYFRDRKKLGTLVQFEVSLADHEKDLLDTLKIEHSIGLEIKAISNKQLEGLYLRYLADVKVSELKGVKSVFDKDKRFQAVRQLREKIDKEKYQVFACGGYADERDYYLAIIKTTDRYDLLRVQETNGINYDIETPRVIDFLRKWEKTAKFFILDVEHDRIIIQFENLDFDLDQFCEETIEFCPDFLNAFKDADDLKRYIEKQKTVDFWWD